MLEIVLREKRWKSNYLFYTRNCFKAKALKSVRGFFICRSPIIHLPPPSLIMHLYCPQFLFGLTVRGEIENKRYAKFCRASKVYYGDVQMAKTKNLLSEFVTCLGSPGAIKFEIPQIISERICLLSLILRWHRYHRLERCYQNIF